MVKQAVILAAGNGSRLRTGHADQPKPLRKVAGLPLLKRNILMAHRAGIAEFFIVVGYEGEKIKAALLGDASLKHITLNFIDNPHWQKSNGVSLLQVKDHVRDRFVLMMADHVFSLEAMKLFFQAELQSRELLLGVDRDLASIFDLEDVTKVQTQAGGIVAIGKELKAYDAYDTGLFLCTSEIFAALEEIHRQSGDASLSEGVRALAKRQLARVYDLSGFFWQDVDTPESLRHAEQHLYRQLSKPTDGWISRNFNRKISVFFTRLLIKTGLSPNHVTGLVTLIGILSGYFVSAGRYPEVFLGGLFFNLASILDGCDGEMARLKLSYSKLGEWLDTLSDNLTYLAFLVGVAIGVHRQHPSNQVIVEATLMFAGVLLTLSVMFFYLLKYTNSGSLVEIQKDLAKDENNRRSSRFSKTLSRLKFMMKRDFFALLFMALAMANQLHVILYLSLIGANLTWVFLLVYKKEIFKVSDRKAVGLNR